MTSLFLALTNAQTFFPCPSPAKEENGAGSGPLRTGTTSLAASTAAASHPKPHRADWGKNFYAVQTYSDIPNADGRRIQVSWMRGGTYPKMPFNQQMGFPCELTLRRVPEGLRLFREPVREIAFLRTNTQEWSDKVLAPNQNLIAAESGDLFDI